MQDLKDVTNKVHYENYRCQKLAGVVNSPDPKHAQFQAPSRLVACGRKLQQIHWFHYFSLDTPTNNFNFISFLLSPTLPPLPHLPGPSHISPHPRRDPIAQFEVEKREHEVKMRKMEQEMEEVFEMKVQEKLQKLKDIEADVSLMEKGV